MSFDEKPLMSSQDDYTPAQIAERVAAAGIAKGQMSTSRLFVLAILAPAFFKA
jgi:formate/nitrite transporter FocA (FNT family)